MTAPERLDIALDRDDFMRTLIRELTGTLQDVIGNDEAAGFISVVGLTIGRQINALYRDAMETAQLTRPQVADTLVDLKRRIAGDFFIIEQDDQRIVLGNRACPFGDKVIGRPALCMMTSNVFGTIAAENLGYAKVEIEEAIATGASGCRIVVHLTPDARKDLTPGRVYVKTFQDE